MDALPSNARAGRIGRLAGVLAAVVLVVTSGWWIREQARSRALDRALEPWSDTAPGPVDAPVDPALADLGAEVFARQCASCHALRGPEKVGPNLAGVTIRRDPEWTAAMIQRPDSMVEHDRLAGELQQVYGARMMVPGGMSPSRTLAVMEFLRRVDTGGS